MKTVLVSAGDAITARLIEQAGFDGIWISGFEVSARMGLQDNGSLTMTEMLSVARPIVEAVRIPVYVDVDTGYGNFQRTVREFEKAGAAGICVEDNVPELKVNSLWGKKIPLMAMEDFGKKIMVKRSNIKIIARTEAIIRGYGLGEAGKRLLFYAKCGADILMPHTRRSDLIFLDKLPKPMAIVPTKFPEVTSETLFKMGYSMVIWANQMERAKIKAIREAANVLKKDGCAFAIESCLSATLDDLKGLVPDV